MSDPTATRFDDDRDTAGSFPHFMRSVDRIIGRKFGLTHEDLADFCWRDVWECGDSPAEAVAAALAAEFGGR